MVDQPLYEQAYDLRRVVQKIGTIPRTQVYI